MAAIHKPLPSSSLSLSSESNKENKSSPSLASSLLLMRLNNPASIDYDTAQLSSEYPPPNTPSSFATTLTASTSHSTSTPDNNKLTVTTTNSTTNDSKPSSAAFFKPNNLNTPSNKINKTVDRNENSNAGENVMTENLDLRTPTPLKNSAAAITSNLSAQSSGSGGRFLAIRNWLRQNKWRKSKDKSLGGQPHSSNTTPTKPSNTLDSPLSTSLQKQGGVKILEADSQVLLPASSTATVKSSNHYISPFQIFNSLDSKSKKNLNKTKKGNLKKLQDEEINASSNGGVICIANSTIINTLISGEVSKPLRNATNDNKPNNSTGSNANANNYVKTNGSSVVFISASAATSACAMSLPALVSTPTSLVNQNNWNRKFLLILSYLFFLL